MGQSCIVCRTMQNLRMVSMTDLLWVELIECHAFRSLDSFVFIWQRRYISVSYCILCHFVMCVIALWYAVVCHAVLWCSVLRCIVVCAVMLWCAVLHGGMCYCIVVTLLYLAVCCFVLCYSHIALCLLMSGCHVQIPRRPSASGWFSLEPPPPCSCSSLWRPTSTTGRVCHLVPLSVCACVCACMHVGTSTW